MSHSDKPARHRSPALLLIAALAVVALGTACASSKTAGEQFDDAGITAKVKTKLAADPEINPFNIDVDSNRGVVRLSGTVDDQATRREAVKLASQTEGVVRVTDDLRVGEKTVGESVDDVAIVAKVNAKLVADPELSPLGIDVDSEKGVVTLTGSVQTAAMRSKVADLARSVDGVRSVQNRLEVAAGR